MTYVPSAVVISGQRFVLVKVNIFILTIFKIVDRILFRICLLMFQGGEVNERTHLLVDPVSNNTNIQRVQR